MSLYQYAVIHRPQMSAKEINTKAEQILVDFLHSRPTLKMVHVSELKTGINYLIESEEKNVTGLVSINDNRVVFFMFGVESAEDDWTAKGDIQELMEAAFPGSVDA